jgi:hypothetical protein
LKGLNLIQRVLLVCGNKTKEACGVDQLRAGLEAGIEAGACAAKLLWQERSHEEEWGSFLLVDASNAFTKGNGALMPWTSRHEWPSGRGHDVFSIARHVFDCHRHFAILVLVRTGDNLFLVILSKAGATQGDPLAMVMRGVGLFPLVQILKKAVSDAHHPWHADDAGAGGHFQKILLCLEKLQEVGPPRRECFQSL